ncbi:twin-arginine translocase subunit TatC [Neomoorella thermoacetica]|uniref:Sec-independent protein translocase protein TatC n=2 Tax=Neomoorella thermoacetica TaxID=1525 RepID=A0A1D7XAR1_NEOTH|nr:twin-arginine translocase subunit TatC [Moorella thermoacetica]AOQ24005.1 Sec-independent protein translocase protein TatC [Moorella thermoacetica]APC08446.1 Sec-independent protein translocase protein TatC [Moorella thermoacetica]OIQ09250.1 Sec-independent protein translocase protein TatC [Moorella thermoacetica]OIQ56422.1 Sec-independent protein translocase protein TatC [Moorella thermoacetica]TYL14409.1 Sec-independent protein translocase protein TatC [Moorella thermoacetica]
MEDKSMTLTEHLEALRRVLLVSIIALVIATIAVYFGFREQLLALILRPMKDLGIKPVFITPWEAFFTTIKICFVAAIFLALPVILWEVWSFVLPALHSHERRLVYMLMPASIILFVGGVVFGYLVVFPAAVRFLLVTASEGFMPFITISRYFGFLSMFVLPFGAVFQLPLIIMLLTHLGLVTPRFLAKNRKYAVLIIFIVAAVVTPTPDMVSQTLMALPMVVLYEASIWISYLVRRKREEKVRQEGI